MFVILSRITRYTRYPVTQGGERWDGVAADTTQITITVIELDRHRCRTRLRVLNVEG